MKTVIGIQDEKNRMSKRLAELQEMLRDITAEEKKAVDVAGEDLLFGGQKAASGPELATLHARRESISAAVELAQRKISAADTEIDDLLRAQELAALNDLFLEIDASMARLGELIGKSGAKGELDHLGDLLKQAQPVAAKRSQDAEIRIRGLIGLWRQGTDGLSKIWAALELDKPGRPGPSTDSTTGEIVGFGRADM